MTMPDEEKNNPGKREKIKFNFCFRTSLWCLKSFIEIAFRHVSSPVNLLRIFRTLFPENTSEWLLLYFQCIFAVCTKLNPGENLVFITSVIMKFLGLFSQSDSKCIKSLDHYSSTYLSMTCYYLLKNAIFVKTRLDLVGFIHMSVGKSKFSRKSKPD